MPCSSKWDIGDLSCTFAMDHAAVRPAGSTWENNTPTWTVTQRVVGTRWPRANLPKLPMAKLHEMPKVITSKPLWTSRSSPMATGVGSLIWAIDSAIRWSIHVAPQNTIHVLDHALFCLTNSNSKCISSWHDELMCMVQHPLLSKRADALWEGKK